ncbi:hypothetical protein Q7507_10535 [Glaesserella parasuis]|nr:hypothetical protein [Glaesserella parasuis]MDO9699755.1 hypothetical protein [Glaesserella parasuis]MDO9810802.1 hypothetical protein [Glaesserella parasuis]MDP0262872.1 hypothetical protein [Glaesserella parasuis]
MNKKPVLFALRTISKSMERKIIFRDTFVRPAIKLFLSQRKSFMTFITKITLNIISYTMFADIATVAN